MSEDDLTMGCHQASPTGGWYCSWHYGELHLASHGHLKEGPFLSAWRGREYLSSYDGDSNQVNELVAQWEKQYGSLKVYTQEEIQQAIEDLRNTIRTAS